MFQEIKQNIVKYAVYQPLLGLLLSTSCIFSMLIFLGWGKQKGKTQHTHTHTGDGILNLDWSVKPQK